MNTENGIGIFGKTIRILVFGNRASVGSRDHFSMLAPDISGTVHSHFEAQKV